MDHQAQRGPEPRKTDGGSVRTPYARPVLKVYGKVAALTHSVGMNGTVTDTGGMGSMTKTS
jgi:hypothetical protein